MGVLTEVSNEEELERAIALKAKVVGLTTATCAICRLI
jgi:indole-3-glycerol phosphate synthase/phosphoribosylanthranilate isomerase